MITAEVVVIGGGIVGSSVALHLRRDGVLGRVLVIERDPSYARDQIRSRIPDMVLDDINPIIGEHPELAGFFLANGFSGHGLMLAPATGKVVSELIRLGRADTVDVTPFRIERFARGELFWDDSTI